jgi:hypothetical protein
VVGGATPRGLNDLVSPKRNYLDAVVKVMLDGEAFHGLGKFDPNDQVAIRKGRAGKLNCDLNSPLPITRRGLRRCPSTSPAAAVASCTGDGMTLSSLERHQEQITGTDRIRPQYNRNNRTHPEHQIGILPKERQRPAGVVLGVLRPSLAPAADLSAHPSAGSATGTAAVPADCRRHLRALAK